MIQVPPIAGRDIPAVNKHIPHLYSHYGRWGNANPGVPCGAVLRITGEGFAQPQCGAVDGISNLLWVAFGDLSQTSCVLGFTVAKIRPPA